MGLTSHRPLYPFLPKGHSLGATPWLDGFHGSESENVTCMIRMIHDMNRGIFFFWKPPWPWFVEMGVENPVMRLCDV